MREFKFRCWDELDNKWFYTDMDHLVEFGVSHTDIDHSRTGQSTGLKDKNGNEIYEGDIVRVPQYMFSNKPFNYENNEVVFNRGKFVLKGEVYKEGYTKYINISDTEEGIDKVYISNVGEKSTKFIPHVEIIGNIHENPELLTKNK